MSFEEQVVLQAAYKLCGGQPEFVTVDAAVADTGLPRERVGQAIMGLRNRGLCTATFGGLQLNDHGMQIAALL